MVIEAVMEMVMEVMMEVVMRETVTDRGFVIFHAKTDPTQEIAKMISCLAKKL